MTTKRRFAGYPSAIAYEAPDGKAAVEHLLWGFYIGDKGEKKGSYKVKDIHGVERKGKYVKCHIRGHKLDVWIREHEIQTQRLLEVIFVDIGQGDGCLMVTPDDEAFVIDAGEEDNMYRFLRWRYGTFKRKFAFKAGIMTHPDQDHYGGFAKLFDEPNVTFETIYHNGIMERFGKNPLGKKKKIGKRSYLTEFVKSKSDLVKFLSVKSRWERKKNGRTSNKKFPTMLKHAVDETKFKHYKMLSTESGHLPGFESDKNLCIEVLGPLVETKNGTKLLRWLSSVGKTKNGHSVVLKLHYKDISMLLGGDLNIPSEHLLLKHHTELNCPPKSSEDEAALVEAGREVFQVDIAKACHHGSSDIDPLFLQSINPLATVISSGDDEPHSHPRADALGLTGMHSRGTRPLIFSTELARSAKERIKHPNILRETFRQDLKAILDSPATTNKEKAKRKKKAEKFTKETEKLIDRSVAVYGAISVVTDGEKVVIAQKLERSRGNSKKWDIYRLEPEGNGPLRYQSKH